MRAPFRNGAPAWAERTQAQGPLSVLAKAHPLDYPAVELEAHAPQAFHECLGLRCAGSFNKAREAGVEITVVYTTTDVFTSLGVAVNPVGVHQQQAKTDD
ncbi:hypothetical protein D3C73_1110600 [compost metagenome]